MSIKTGRVILVLFLVLAACCGPVLAQSTRTQGPATTQSQNFSYPSGNGAAGLLVLVLGLGLGALASGSAGYWMTYRSR